jgi:hypothetical protein
MALQLNAATVDVLSSYLTTGSSNGLHTIRLNNCGLTGAQLARLFYSMGRARPVELHINGSRLDEGVNELCLAITEGYGPWSLFVQMVEFAMEINYIKLLKALTVSTAIECLNLAGTSTPEAASTSACQAIADFFAKNRTVRFLDISGFDSRLDEGRLGREFSKALIGLRTNESIEHLRVRSQMLNINIGDLAEAISENKTLHTLDCEGNDFNLSNYRHLVSSMEKNTAIRQFSAFSTEDLKKATSKSMDTAATATPVRRSSVMSRFKPEKIASTSSKPLVQRLKDEWDMAVSDSTRILQRNQVLFDQENAAEQDESSSQEHHRSNITERAFCAAFGGLSLRDLESQRGRGVRSSQDSQQATSGDLAIRRHSRWGSTGSREIITRPTSMISSEVAVSPSTDTASNGSGGVPTPPECESPIESDLGLAAEILASTIFDEPNYTYADGHDGDDGLQMKRYRRYMGDPTSRIDEEEGANDTESS